MPTLQTVGISKTRGNIMRKRIGFLITVAMLLSATLYAEVKAGPGIAMVETEKGTIQGYITDPEGFQDVPYAKLAEASDKALTQAAEEYRIPAALGSRFDLDWEPVIDGDFLPENPVTDEGFADGAEEYGMLIGSNLTEWSAISLLADPSASQFDNPDTCSEEEIERRLQERYREKADAVVSAFLEA